MTRHTMSCAYVRYAGERSCDCRPVRRIGTTLFAIALVVLAVLSITLVAAPRGDPDYRPVGSPSQDLPWASPTGGISTTGTIEATAPPRVSGPSADGTRVEAPGSTSPAVRIGNVSETATGSGELGGAVLPDTSTSVNGKASWFCGAGSRCTSGYPASGLYAAAGPALRVGDWRGRIVRVCSGGRCVSVKLIDFCQCFGAPHNPNERVIDLYRSAFSRLASPSRGVIPVEVTWGANEPASTLPPTSTGG